MKKNNKKIYIILGVIIGSILVSTLSFFLYIVFGSKRLDMGYDYESLKKEFDSTIEVEYSKLPNDLINAVISEVNSDNQLLGGTGKWYTKISYLILRDNNIINYYDDVPLKSLKLVYFISRTIEKDFTNEEIITYYLNDIYFGSKDGEPMYGIKNAAKGYFDKDAENLSLSECAMLAGILIYPSKYNPYSNYEGAIERKNIVLELMYLNNYITKEQKENAEGINPTLEPKSELSDFNQYSLVLKKSKEVYDFDKLHLEFNGEKIDDGNFKYSLDIKYDGNNINDSFFDDKNNLRIWSYNMASQFNVYKIYNVYILDSYIAKQCFGHELLIINTNGEVLKTFSGVDFYIQEDWIKISASDNNQCMGPDWEEHIRNYEYTISDNGLVETN